jgi:hypothetical protein
MHGVFISSFWQFWFFLKAILPEWVGVNTPFPAPNYVSVARFRGSLDSAALVFRLNLLYTYKKVNREPLGVLTS